MQLSLIKIGNSKGIRIPSKLIEIFGFDKEIDVQVIEDLGLLLKPAEKAPREGWKEAFEKMHELGEDQLLISDNLDVEYISELEW